MLRHRLAALSRGSWLEPALQEADEVLWAARGWMRGSYSQHGEDRFLLQYFGSRPGTYVDVGANYPVKISNTYLLYRHGWSGVTVEPILRLFRRQQRWRRRDIQLQAIVSTGGGARDFVECFNTGLSHLVQPGGIAQADESAIRARYQVSCMSLTDVFCQLDSKSSPDLLSVDTEGHDLHVLQSLDWARFRPRVIIYELATSTPDAVGEFLSALGYRSLRSFGCNRLVSLETKSG